MEQITSVDTEQQGIIHDSQYDYYGRKLATSCSDGKIALFETLNDTMKKIAEITGHEGPVWQLSWSHPRFGSLLASCGFDRKIFLWKETLSNKWEKIYEYAEHQNSVNCIAFAPQEFGLIFAAGSLDGFISIHEYKNDIWEVSKYFAHGFGVNSIAWANSSQSNEDQSSLRFVSCGMDHLIRIWNCKRNDISSFYTTTTLEGHDDIVRDVSWRNSPLDSFVSGGEDNIVYLWISQNSKTTNDDNNIQISSNMNNASDWNKFELKKLSSPISKLAWDTSGNYLHAVTSDGLMYLLKESPEGSWNVIALTNPDGIMTDGSHE